MERQIKFRAWDIPAKKYRGINGLQDLFSIRSDGFCNEDYVLEQFTGLTDKNGKEIFENDLVQDPVLIFKVEWNEQNAKFCINPVGRVSGEFDGIIEVIMYADLGNGYYSRKDLEIIGNIHENENLLK